MNRNYILALTLIATAASATAADVSIGLIDFARIQESYYRTEAERETFTAERDKKLAAIDAQREEVKKLMTEQQADGKRIEDPTLSDENRARITVQATERARKILSMQGQIRQAEEKANSELSKEAQRVQRSITKEIYDKIGELAEAKGFDLVLNRSFGINGVPTLAYSRADNLPDYTDEVVAALNETAPAAAEANSE